MKNRNVGAIHESPSNRSDKNVGAEFIPPSIEGQINQAPTFIISSSSNKQINVDLNNSDQSKDIKGLIKVSGNDKVNLTIRATLRSQKTNCHIDLAVIASGNATVDIDANILVERGAAGSSAVFRVKTLILDGTPKITVQPFMEVKNNESKAVHGVSTMRLSDESLFYARSRGLDENNVKTLLVENVVEAFMTRKSD